MSLFHKDLDKQLAELVNSLKRGSLQMPENWHWLDYKSKAELIKIEDEDLTIIKKLNKLHEQGKDISLLTTRMLQLCNELIQHLETVRKGKDLNQRSEEGKRITLIIDEVSQIYSREFSIMKHESKKLIYDNSSIQNFKTKLIDALNKKNVNWDVVQMHTRDLLCTRKAWQELTKGETDLFKLIGKGEKYEEYDKVYRNTLAVIESEVNKNRQMTITKEGSAWFHIETSPDMPSKSSFLGFSMKRYSTIDPSSMWDMLKYLIKLANSLRQIGLKYADSINVKIPASFLSFMKHPDSIVIHYHNRAVKSEIETALQSWLSDYRIKVVKREYERVEHARDVMGTSFSDNVAQTVTEVMHHNYGKMSNEALVIAGINYAFKMSKEGL